MARPFGRPPRHSASGAFVHRGDTVPALDPAEVVTDELKVGEIGRQWRTLKAA